MSKLEKWQDEAAAQGWTFQRNVDKRYGTYTHNTCGHTQHVQKGDMRINNVRCRGCEIANWKTEATAQGWVFVAQVDAQYGSYVHNACKCLQNVQFSAMRRGFVLCRQCTEQAWRNDAAAQGWTFITQIKRHYGNYSHNNCGHIQGVSMSAMRTGEVACHGCGESWATKPSNLYLLDIVTACGQRFLKLGIAQIVARRATLYGLTKGAKVKVLYAKAYATGTEACKVEKQLHKTVTTILCVKRFKGAKKLMNNGHTECYEYSEEAAGYLLLNLPN